MNHTKQKSWPQRLLALLAAVVLCAALPAAALAEENMASIQTQVSETDEDIPWADCCLLYTSASPRDTR